MNKSVSTFIRLVAFSLLIVVSLLLVSCDQLPFGDIFGNGGEDTPPACEHKNVIDNKCIGCGEYFISTVEELNALAGTKLADGKVSTQRYYVSATVKELTHAISGAMVIEDETGSIVVDSLCAQDGTPYASMEEKPDNADKVLLHCVVENRGGTISIKIAYVVEFEAIEEVFETPEYISMTIAEARNADKDALVRVKGVVARITYAFGIKPSGVMLVDETGSIYVYDKAVAESVEIGNTIEITATKTYWILEDEVSNATKFGYKGANQLEDVTLLSNDKGNTAFDKSWITETTVKEIMDTPVTEDITNKIFKVTALVKKAPGSGYTNYYIDDIDGVTGSYVYTQCNGNDFGWLDKFDGKFCTVYLVAINAKSSSSGCIWRFLPIEVADEGYEFNLNDAAKYAVKYHGIGQFQPEYTGDPAAELITSVSSELLGFEGATLSYSSSDEKVVYFTEADGIISLHCGAAGTATVTVTAKHGDNSYSEDIEITVAENAEVEYITVADAIKTPYDTDVVVKGIVGPSLVNRTGFYLFGEDGSVIAVLVSESAFEGIAIGHEIIISGMRERFVKNDEADYAGQTCIVNAEIIANYYGNHEYSTEKFITDKTVDDLRNLDNTVDYSTTVFVTEATVTFVETGYYTKLEVKSPTSDTTITLYCSGAGQYSFLKPYSGQTVTLELAACNWNDKGYWTFCALSVVNEDGTKVLNTLNFN